MHFHQVALTVLAFSSSRGAGLESSPQSLTVIPMRGPSRIIVEQDLKDPSAWQVRLNTQDRTPVILPAVTTQEGLQDALTQAWQMRPPGAVYLTRFHETSRAHIPVPGLASWPMAPISSPKHFLSRRRPGLG